MPPERKQIPVLTGLRGVAAYSVLIDHSIDTSIIKGLRGLVWANSGWKADKRGHLNVDDGEDCAGRSWLPRSTAALIACMLGLPNVLGCQGL
jgi:hypothetical protein